ncbi:AEC family transporter [Odoribacter sp. OttesenSCG-928-G04]|nr:AEC family transporter [Odoribacter sp. OttesenSCG-928-G04]MDL2331051.1 AEC family transporter [Odoribacter sp. OttesenSCG-928-A06]
MTNFILIVLCISVGIVMSRLRILPEGSFKSVNAWLLYVALPALALRFVPEIEWSPQLLLPGLSPILVWAGAWLFVMLYARKREVNKQTQTALLVACGLGNTSFLGFPLISAYYGEDQIHHAIVFDQVTFLLFSTVAVVAVLRASGIDQGRTDMGYILRKVLCFPPFIACLVALVFSRWIDFSPAFPLLDKFVATLSPLALFSIGLQLKLSDWKKEQKHLYWGLFYKLLLAPLFVFLFLWLMNGTGNLAKITVFEASMPSHITASLLASQYNMNPKLCSLMVGFGIIGGFLTTLIWWLVGEYFFVG